MAAVPPNPENSGHAFEIVASLKPVLEVTDFQFYVEPLTGDDGALTGAKFELSHPTWPGTLRLKLDRLTLVELGTGVLALVDSFDKREGGEQ